MRYFDCMGHEILPTCHDGEILLRDAEQTPVCTRVNPPSAMLYPTLILALLLSWRGECGLERRPMTLCKVCDDLGVANVPGARARVSSQRSSISRVRVLVHGVPRTLGPWAINEPFVVFEEIPHRKRKIKAAWPHRVPGFPIPQVASNDPAPTTQYGRRFAYLRITREFERNTYTLWSVGPEGERRLDPPDPDLHTDIMGVVG